MQVYFSTVIRDAPPKQGGELVWLDWQTKQVKRRVPIVATNPDLNDLYSGSSTRGGRGIQVLGERVIVASYHTLKIFDRELVHLRDVSHPLMVGLHEVCVDGTDAVWVCCTAVDAALRISLKNGAVLRQFWPAEMPEFQQRFGVTPTKIDKQADNRTLFLDKARYKLDRLHLNSIAVWQGEVYAFLADLGAVVNLGRRETVIQDVALRGGHNLIIQDDGTAILNDTYCRAIRFYNLHTGSLQKVVNLTDFPAVRALLRKHDAVYWWRKALRKAGLCSHTPPRPLFVRGMSLAGDWLFVGVSPAAILCLDWQRGELIDMYCYAQDVHVCVHGLMAVGKE